MCNSSAEQNSLSQPYTDCPSVESSTSDKAAGNDQVLNSGEMWAKIGESLGSKADRAATRNEKAFKVCAHNIKFYYEY